MAQAETKECPVCGVSNLSTVYVCKRCGHKFTVTDQSESRTKKPIGRRIPWIAGLLSILVTGLGHVYNGQAKRGIRLYCILWLIGLATAIIMVAVPTPANIVLMTMAMAIGFAFYLYVIIDSIRTARKIDDTYHLTAYNRWYIYVAVVVLSVFVAPSDALRGMVVRAYTIPSGTMLPALQIGDRILVDKLTYGIRNPIGQGYLTHYAKPKRGDVVVFIYPVDRSKNFIKRVIAVGGDNVEIRDKKVFINDNQIEDAHAYFPQKEANQNNVQLRDNYGPKRVPMDHYFVLGDHRDRSYDSRFWGFVPFRDVEGKVAAIYWSWDREKSKVRWNRIGMEIE